MKLAKLSFCAASLVAAAIALPPSTGEAALPKVAKPLPGKRKPKAKAKAKADKLAASLKMVRSRQPGAPVRDLEKLAKLAKHRGMPNGLRAAERKVVTVAVRHYRAGRDRRAAKAMRQLVQRLKASGRSSLLPAVYGFVTYRTTVANHPSLANTVRRYDFEKRKLAAIENRLKVLKRERARAKGRPVAVNLTRWQLAPKGFDGVKATEVSLRLTPVQLQQEILYQSKQRDLASSTLVAFATVFDPKSSETDIEEAQSVVENAEGAARAVVDNAEEAANQAIDNVEETVNEAIDEAAGAVNDAIEEAENAVNEAIEEAKNAANEVIDAAEEQRNEPAGDPVDNGEGDSQQSELERLNALADRLCGECTGGNVTSCEELSVVAAQIADELAKLDAA